VVTVSVKRFAVTTPAPPPLTSTAVFAELPETRRTLPPPFWKMVGPPWELMKLDVAAVNVFDVLVAVKLSCFLRVSAQDEDVHLSPLSQSTHRGDKSTSLFSVWCRRVRSCRLRESS
jgi:hypothetical protein